MARNFDNPYSAELIGLWDFRDGAENDDTGLGDGVAQDGTPVGNAGFGGGWLLTGGNGDRFEVPGEQDEPFDLDEGTLMVEFRQFGYNSGGNQTIVSRGELDPEAEGEVVDGIVIPAQETRVFEVILTETGALKVLHVDGTSGVLLGTDDGFAAPEDVVRVTYSWSGEDGPQLLVENVTQGTTSTDSSTVTGLSLNLTDPGDPSFTIAALATPDGVAQDFEGGVDFVAVLDAPVIGQGDGIVDGTAGDDLIDLAYTGDPEGDRIDAGDAIIPGDRPDQDRVDAGAGDDTIMAGADDDTVYAGSGSDEVHGNDGNDVLYGDANLPGGGGGGTAREVFRWDLAPDPDDGGDVDDGDDLSGGFTQDTGNVDVTFSLLSEDPDVDTEFDDRTQNTGSINTGGGAVNPNSSLLSDLNGNGCSGQDNSATYQLDFSESVSDVSFRINDVDGNGAVRVQAFDAEGNAITVNLSGGSGVDLSDEDSLPGDDTATSTGGYADPNNGHYSVLVTVPGPVTRLVMTHEQDGTDGSSGISVTDVYFDVALPDTGPDGDDTLFGDDGDDVLHGEGGNDELFGGDGSDTVDGGDGQDLVFGGLDDDVDYVYGGAENDIIGALGGDIVSGGEAGVVDFDTLIVGGGIPVVQFAGGDASTEEGTVLIYDQDLNVVGSVSFSEMERVYAIDVDGSAPAAAPTGTGRTFTANVVEGTDGDDLINFGYFGDPEGDRIDNGDGTDPLQPDQDVVVAGAGNDTVTAGEANDLVFGGSGDDSLFGQAGSDGLSGGEGSDSLFGGSGADILVGGAGDDEISGGSRELGDGGDLMFGNTGDDRFVDIGAEDTVFGGEDPDGADVDVLDLTGARETANPGGSLTVDYDPSDSEAGTVTFFDASGVATGTAEFAEIETVIICFTPGSLIATPQGERPVETLAVGDRVITRDNGIQEIRWFGQRGLKHPELVANPQLRPVRIRAGALGNGLPERDMMVSPNHRLLVANDRTAYYFDEREVLVAAKHLTGIDGVDIVEVPETSYIHFMFDQHEVVLSDGAWTESFQPGDYSLQGIASEQRDEILTLFPELNTEEGLRNYEAARRALKKHEAKLLVL